MSFAASRTTAPAFTPREAISSPSITVSVGLPSQSEPTTKTSRGERARRLYARSFTKSGRRSVCVAKRCIPSRSGVEAAIFSAHCATCSRRMASTSFERVSLLSSIFFTACRTCGLFRYSPTLRSVSSAA